MHQAPCKCVSRTAAYLALEPAAESVNRSCPVGNPKHRRISREDIPILEAEERSARDREALIAFREKIVADPVYLRYQAHGLQGWLHHEARTQEREDVLVAMMCNAGYSSQDAVGLMISKVGRWAGDAFLDNEPEARVHDLVSKPSARAWARESYDLASLELE